MSGTDDYIIITGSLNLNDDTANSDDNLIVAGGEAEDASLRTLQKQGIFLEKDTESPVRAKPLDEFSKELLEQSGIEIVSSEEEVGGDGVSS